MPSKLRGSAALLSHRSTDGTASFWSARACKVARKWIFRCSRRINFGGKYAGISSSCRTGLRSISSALFCMFATIFMAAACLFSAESVREFICPCVNFLAVKLESSAEFRPASPEYRGVAGFLCRACADNLCLSGRGLFATAPQGHRKNVTAAGSSAG